MPQVVDKLLLKHGVTPHEVIEILIGSAFYRKLHRGHIQGEDVYSAMGQTEGYMNEGKLIPQMKSYEETAEFWDTHSLVDYWDQTEPVEFEISPDVRLHYIVAVDPEVFSRAQRFARMRGLSTESLVNLLLEQRLHELEAAS